MVKGQMQYIGQLSPSITISSASSQPKFFPSLEREHKDIEIIMKKAVQLLSSSFPM